MQQYYRWTGDKAWLAEIGYPIAEGVAEWIMSRVVLGADGLYHINKVGLLIDCTINMAVLLIWLYHINKVMPVDEWCDPKSGCASPGVNDDPQMNGASVAALHFAAEAAAVLGTASPAQQQEWLDVAAKINIPFGNFSTPFGSYEEVHLMPPHTGTVHTMHRTVHTLLHSLHTHCMPNTVQSLSNYTHHFNQSPSTPSSWMADRPCALKTSW
jgi:hypothetical protein